MPANLTPQYIKADHEFKAAKTIEEKIVCLENMIRLLPKHKHTENMQADMKHKLSVLRKEQAEGKGKPKKVQQVFLVEKEGAGQIALLGAPNAGKSRLVAALTNANVAVAEYPFTTHAPQPGMARYEDVQVQLVDLPPITEDYFETWMPDTVRRADAAILVADLGDDNLLDAMETILKKFEPIKVSLVRDVPAEPEPSHTFRRTFIIANKLDLPGAPERLEILREYYGSRFDILPVSAEAGTGMAEMPAQLFQFLRLIRVYTKEPGKKPDLERPYTMPVGSTVVDLAGQIHRELAETLKSARVWGSGKYDGIFVKRDHVLQDKDVVELHQ